MKTFTIILIFQKLEKHCLITSVLHYWHWITKGLRDKHVAWERKSSDSCFCHFPSSSLTPCLQAKTYLLQIIHIKSSAQKQQGCLPSWLHARDNDLSSNEDQWEPAFVPHPMCHTPINIGLSVIWLHDSQMIWTATGIQSTELPWIIAVNYQ